MKVTCRPRPPVTHLFLTDEQLISLQNHKAVLPDLSEDSFPAELPDPADLIGLNVLRRRVLRSLQTGNRKLSEEPERAATSACDWTADNVFLLKYNFGYVSAERPHDSAACKR